MLALYRQLLRLYPTEHRESFGEEMIAVLAEERKENGQRGIPARARLLLRESTGLLMGAIRERLRGWRDSEKCMSLFGRFTMRNGFRFPKSTIVFMTLILAGVVMAIKRGQDIAVSFPRANQQIGPIQPVHSTLLPPIVFFLVFFYGFGLIGWAILFALRRSGVHRLADISREPK